MSTPRVAEVTRKTAETQIRVKVNLDGTGQASLSTGIGFFDHMLDQIARHGLIDLEIDAKGDLHIDGHHTVEDVGITLGQAVLKAVGDKTGWDVPAMGSDFDGTITHMEPYESSAKFPQFQQDLINFLEETEYNKELWHGYTPKQIIEKIFYKNAMAFYKKFFV